MVDAVAEAVFARRAMEDANDDLPAAGKDTRKRRY
jgi:hypothetical protein